MARRLELVDFPEPPSEEVDRALALLPDSLCVLTASYEHERAAATVPWAMRCADRPPMVCIAAQKGNGVEPLIRDSRCFAISMIDRRDRVLVRAFDRPLPLEGDPLDMVQLHPLVTGSPALARAAAVLDCAVVRHFDIDGGDHELYVGRIVAVRMDPPA